MIEPCRVFRRQSFQRQEAHLILSAMRHRADELGERVTYLSCDTYRDGLAEIDGPLEVIQPTTYAVARLVADLTAERPIVRRPARGFASSRADFVGWASRCGSEQLPMEDFYRDNRVRLGVLMEEGRPVGGRWTFEVEDRESAPTSARVRVPEPHRPAEDEIDAAVRADLDRLAADGVCFVGDDGPRRFAATRTEALAALADFIENQLESFGRYEDAILDQDHWTAHSPLSAPLNLGLLHPLEVVRAAEEAYATGAAPLTAVEGLIRQVIGWRDYVWHLYWFLGPDLRACDEVEAAAFS